MSNIWSNETPEQRESRLAMVACMRADVNFLGVRDGLCYFEAYLTDDPYGPKAVLTLFADGITPEQIANRVAESDGSPKKRNSELPVKRSRR